MRKSLLQLTFLIITYISTYQNAIANEKTLTLSATSEIKYIPKNITLDFVISSFDVKPEESYKIYAESSKTLITTLRAIPTITNINLKSFDLIPRYEYDQRTKILKGYDTNGNLSITTTIESAGTIVELLANNNVSSISNISFSVSENELEEIKTKSANEAVKLALKKADLILNELDLRKAEIISISIDEFNDNTPNFRQSGLLKSNSRNIAQSIIPGENAIITKATIEVEFK